MRRAQRSELIPDVLAGRYEIGTVLGTGGMATVLRARDRKHDRWVAVKVLRRELAASIVSDRFLREIRVAAQLQHPHIVALFDSGEVGGVPYYVMPLVDGESLRQRLDHEKQLPIEDAVRLVREVADALQYAHAHGIVHRDIKPENILIQSGHALLADFGIARAISAAGADRLTQSGLAVGTPQYMSPEQGLTGEIDARSDLYSLGCVLYELLAGQLPFVGHDGMTMIARHSAGAVPSLRDVRPSISAELERVVTRALEKAPADRFQSAAAFSQALDQLLASGLNHQALPRGRTTTSPRDRPQFRRRAVAIASSIAVIGLGVAAALTRLHPAQDQTRPIADSRAGAAVDVLPLRTIAVLYFDPPRNADSLSFLSNAITEVLVARLRGADSITVISQNGVRPFRGRHIPPDSVARALNAGTLVAGALTVSGETLHVTMQLVDGRTGAKVLDASAAGTNDQIFALLDAAAAELARLLQRRLGQEVHLVPRPAGTQNVRAWEALQQVKQTIAAFDSVLATDGAPRTLGTFGSADTELGRIAAMDKRWAAPIVLRGFEKIRQVTRNGAQIASHDSIPKWLDAASTDAEQALALSPNDPDALELRGTVRFFKWAYGLAHDAAHLRALLEGSEADFRSAVAVNPLQETAWAGLSYVLNTRNRFREAAVAARKAYLLDPYAPQSVKDVYRAFQNSFGAGDEFEAKRWCELGGRRFPSEFRFTECRLMQFSFKDANPSVPDVWATYQSLLNRQGGSARAAKDFYAAKWEMFVALALIRAGLPDSASRVATRARARVRAAADPGLECSYYEAIVRSWLGEKDQAFRLLREFSRRNPSIHVEEDDSWWLEDLRLDPRWQELKGTTP